MVKSRIKYLIRKIREKLKTGDWDQVIAVTGDEGVGKSTCAIKIAKLIDHRFNLKKNVAYIPDQQEFVKRFHDLKSGSVYLVDEAVRELHKHQWQNKLQQSITQMYATERYQNKCTILVMPRFMDFTDYFRNHRIRIWIHIFERGYAVVYTRNSKDPTGEDPWYVDYNSKIRNKAYYKQGKFNTKIENIISVERRMKGYICDFKFSDLPPKTKEEYLNLKIESRKNVYALQEEEVLVDPRIEIARKLRAEGNHTIVKVAEIIGVSERTIVKWTSLKGLKPTTFTRDEPGSTLFNKHITLNHPLAHQNKVEESIKQKVEHTKRDRRIFNKLLEEGLEDDSE